MKSLKLSGKKIVIPTGDQPVTELTWTKALPTQPGWYWRRKPGWAPGDKSVDIVYLREYGGTLAINNSTLSDRWCKDWEFAGPLAQPKD